jgi:aspartyl-tRNA(Asn)/glutamyl-tRNA(Gln) amidotransferase subunit B
LQLVRDGGYELIGDAAVVLKAVKEAIVSNPKAVSDYRLGKQTAAKFLVGHVMRMTKGKADPVEVNTLVEEELKAL